MEVGVEILEVLEAAQNGLAQTLDFALKAIPLLAVIGAGVAWLWARRSDWMKNRKEQVKEDRSLLADEFSRLRTANDDLTHQLQEFAPQLSSLRKEYAESVQREINLLEQLKAQAASSTLQAGEVRRLKQAIRELHAEVLQLRDRLREAGIELPPALDTSAIDHILGEDLDGQPNV